MDSIREVDPAQSLEARNAVLSLLGTTLAELKQIDKNIVGSSKNISGIKTDLKNVFNHVTQPQLQPQQQQPISAYVPPSVPTVQPAQHTHPIAVQTDFLVEKLDKVLVKLDSIIDLLKS